MNLCNKSKKHHFISVCEQKFNSVNPTASRRNRKIFSFEVIDKNLHTTHKPNRVETEYNLMMNHLYTLKGADSNMNFENLFKRYEDLYDSLVKSLFSKIDKNINVSQEILSLFHFKIMNLTRNPYLIHIFNSNFKLLDSITPKSNEVKLLLSDIFDNFDNPEVNSICDEYNVDINDYKMWLRKQFILLFDLGNNDFILDEFCKNLFEDSNYKINVDVYRFSHEVCLLSDKGYSVANRINSSNLIFSFDFNISHCCFIRYQFTHISCLIRSDINKEQIKLLKKSSHFQNNRLQYQIFNRDTEEELKELKAYNKAVINSCESNVYQSKDKIYI